MAQIIPWSVMQLTGANPGKAMLAAEVVQLPPLSKNAKTGDVFPAVLALHHKAGSAEVPPSLSLCLTVSLPFSSPAPFTW